MELRPSVTRSPPRSRRCPSSCAARSSGTKAPRWPNTRNFGSTAGCRSTSAIRRALGSAAPTRTPTGCSASTSREGPTCRDTAPTTLPAVERRGDRGEVVGAVSRQVGPSREVLAEQPVGVLVGAALPRALRIAEVDLQPAVDPKLRVLGHLGALVPDERAAQLLGQRRDRGGDRVTDGLSSMPGQRRPVLHPRLIAVARDPRQVQQHRETGRALDERPDRRAVEAQDQIALPVAGDGPIVGLGRPLADHHLGADELLAARLRASARYAQRAPGPQTGDELALERASALHVQGLVDRLMRDPHRLIIGEVDPEPIRDLLRTPRPRPAPVLTTAVATTIEAHSRPGHRLAVGSRDRAGEPVLHVRPQRVVRGELRDLRAARAALRVPLRCRRAVGDRVAPRRRVAAQLPRDRRRGPIQLASDLAYADTLGMKNRDLFPLSKRQIAPRQRGQRDRRHPATVAEPPAANRLRHPRRRGRLLARATSRDRSPEPLPILASGHRRPTRRTHLTAHRSNRLLTLASTHRAPPPSQGVATTN